MKIELSVQEYFNELKKIEDEYVQEEAIYPWIFVLLKMAECKKQEIMKTWYKEVDIINVAGAVPAKSLSGKALSIRNQLTEYVGTPDIAIIKDDKVLGCVEAKSISQKAKSMYKLFAEESCVPNEISFPSTLEEKKIEKKWRWRYDNKNVGIKRENLQEQEEYVPHQLMSHLQKFNKVLYTNGLDFYYMTLEQKDMGKVIKINHIANLSDSFIAYKNSDYTNTLILEATAEWNKLLAQLSGIDWFKQPTNLDFIFPNFTIRNRDQEIINASQKKEKM